ncbi:CGNR zinc finger domain-containing protein, partial [Streptomyces sp. L7]
MTSPSLTRVRDCAGPTCGALFLDTSRPGNRRWCSMGTCGNRAKKETLRGRTAWISAPERTCSPLRNRLWDPHT